MHFDAVKCRSNNTIEMPKPLENTGLSSIFKGFQLGGEGEIRTINKPCDFNGFQSFDSISTAFTPKNNSFDTFILTYIIFSAIKKEGFRPPFLIS